MNAETKVWLAFNGNYLNNLNFQANVDECERAAEIYQCGKEKAPLVTHAVQSGLTDISPMPQVFFTFFVSCSNLCVFFKGIIYKKLNI
jgi:hypothetical protein